MSLPPRWVRRLVLAPAVPLLTLLALTALPIAVIAAAFASPLLPGRWRPLRVLAFALVVLVAESLALLGLAGLWVGAGWGTRLDAPRWQDAHWALVRRYVATLRDAARRAFGLRFHLEVARAGDAEDPIGGRGPLLVFSRHAGPGDSFLLVDGLLQRGWRPRIVLREALQWAPALDVALNRLPSHFVAADAPAGAGAAAIADLAAGLDADGALVLFPEGRNFTPARRARSIARLEELGDHQAAEEARQMRYVLTPRSGGASAAIAAAGGADVLFVAHTGLEDLSSLVDLWRGVPLDAEVEVDVWRVPAAEVPTEREAARSWLHGWWRHIDGWIHQRHGPAAVPDAAVARLEPPSPDDPAPDGTGGTSGDGRRPDDPHDGTPGARS